MTSWVITVWPTKPARGKRVIDQLEVKKPYKRTFSDKPTAERVALALVEEDKAWAVSGPERVE